MITDNDVQLALVQYARTGVFKQEIRSYEVSLWTLQDEFITVLKWANAEQKGRIEEPKMILNIDGTQKFTFTIPMYFYNNGKMVPNPNWESMLTHPNWNNDIPKLYSEDAVRINNIVSTRKVKVIFNKHTKDEAVFEFMIIDVKESHENDILTCEVSCDGLAFHELGKIGYRYVLSADEFYQDYVAHLEQDPNKPYLQNIDYWCKKINLVPYPNVASKVNAATWYYKVEMKWKSFDEKHDRARLSNKIYEEGYTSSWDDELRPKTTQFFKEKERPVEAKNSNIYNITQTIAETFGVFCRYDYGYDENYHIISRTAVFYNSFLQEDEGITTISYPNSSSKISREMDAENITTKLYVLNIDDDSTFEGYHTIMNAEPNASRENYILNFDYMYKIGNISQEQYDAIKPYEKSMREINDKLLRLQNNRMAYEALIPKLEGQLKVYKNSKTAATEQIAQCQDLRNALDLTDGDADGYITITANNPDTKFIQSDKVGGNYINLDNANKGIISSTLHIYRNYNFTTHELSGEILNFTPIYDEFENLSQIKGLPYIADNESSKVYMIYKYNPKLYYDSILISWETRLAKDNTEILALEEQLGDKDYEINEDISVSDYYDALVEAIAKSIIPPTVEIDYYNRPHILDDNGNIITYYSSSYGNYNNTRNILLTPILPNGYMFTRQEISNIGNEAVETVTRASDLNTVIYDDGVDKYTLSDIFMGLYVSLYDVDDAANAYHNYHEAIMMANAGGLYKIQKDTNTEIDALNERKQKLILQFERLMGAALREGYWQPEDYNDYGEKKVVDLTLPPTSGTTVIAESTGTDMILDWESKSSDFDEELDIHYQVGVEQTTNTYPCVNLTSILPQISGRLDEYSFIYNNNYLEENVSDENNVKNLGIYNFGGQAQLRFVRVNEMIFPALVLIGAKSLSGTKEDNTTPLGFFWDREKSKPRLAIVNSHVNPDTGLLTTTITNTISLSDASFWKFNGSDIDTCDVTYPRIKCSSLALKINEDDLRINYNNKLLKMYDDYYVNMRNVKRDNNYYAEYFITIRPNIIYQEGLDKTFTVNYILSNANTAIYLDAKEVSNENAVPKVSYEVTPNILNTSFARVLYQKLAQLVQINDTELKLQNTFGYISELQLNLDDVSQDSITIKNYKTKFEDLFSTIIAQTESMKRASGNLTAAANGGVPLNSDAFTESLSQHEKILQAYLDSYFDSSQVVQNRLQELFDQAGEILGGANETLNKMQTVTSRNASILSGFAENVADALTVKVYRGPERPENFKFGDIWIQTDPNDPTRVIGRYMATSNGQSLDGSSHNSFVRTYDGTLAQIMGASLNVDAEAGIIDVKAQNYINIKSGKSVYIAANENVDIIGNRQVNIGGAEINLCTLPSKVLNDNEQWVDGWEDNQGNKHYEVKNVETTGINLIAGTYDDLNNALISKVLISPHKVELGSADIIMKAASSIELLASKGSAANTAAISISADNGVWIGAGAGLRLYSGTAADHIYVGPKHKAIFKKGDIWVKVNQVGNNGHDSYDGDPALSNALTLYYTNFVEKGQGEGVYAGTYIATSDWSDVYTTEALSRANADSTDGWTRNDNIIDLSDVSNARGASVELDEDHLLFGFSNVANGAANTSAVEMTEDYVVIAAGQGFENMADRAVTGNPDSGLIGAKFTANDIGLAVSNNDVTTALIMNNNGLTLGSGMYNVNLATATKTQLRNAQDAIYAEAVREASEAEAPVSYETMGSYVRIAPDGIELGSMADLYINTDNFKLQTHSRDKGNVMYQNGDTLLAIGRGMQGVQYNTSIDDIRAMAEREINPVDIRLVLNKDGLYLKGDIFANDGVFNGTVYASAGSFNGNVTAQSLTLVDTSGHNNNIQDFFAYVTQLQAQVDNEIDTWFGSIDPTPNNKTNDTMSASAGSPNSDWTTETDKNRHLGDLYYNEISGQGFRWGKHNQQTYMWLSISDTELTNIRTNVREIADGTTGLAFTATPTNIFTVLNNTLGLVIFGNQVTTGTHAGMYPFFRASNNAMGFFYATSPSQAAVLDDTVETMLYYEDGDMYISGTLYADDVRIRNSRSDSTTVTWNQFFTNLHNSYMTEVTNQATALFNEAGDILFKAQNTLDDLSNLTTTNQTILQGFINKVVDTQADQFSGPTVPTTFKPGDIWTRTSQDGNTILGKYTAHSYSSDRPSGAINDTTNGVFWGWNRVSDGSLASITGAGLKIDGEAGTIDLWGGSKISIKTSNAGLLDLAGGNVTITGEHSINIGSKQVNINSYTDANDNVIGGINITSTSINTSTATNGTTGRTAGTEYVSINKAGVKIVSSNIEVASSGAINVYANRSGQEASAVTIDANGVTIASTSQIMLTSNQGETPGKVAGANLELTPERILFGVQNNANATSVSMDSYQIILAAGNVVNQSGGVSGDITTGGSVAGVQIRKDYIGMATGAGQTRAMISLRPDKILIGGGFSSDELTGNNADYTNGSYLLINTITATVNNQQKRIANFEIGSTAVFRVLTPTFLINNNANDTSMDMLYLANVEVADWNNAGTKGIRYDNTNGLRIKASRLDVEANNIYIGTSSTLQDQLDNTVTETIKWYTTSKTDTVGATNGKPAVQDGVALSNSWVTTLKKADSTNKFVWSVIQYVHGDGSLTYDTVKSEGTLKELTKLTYKKYIRTNSATTPTVTNGTALSSTASVDGENKPTDTGWQYKIPAATIEITNRSTPDTSTGVSKIHKQSTVTLPYLYSVEVTERIDGYVSYGTVQREALLEDATTGKQYVDDIIAGRTSVPYVKSSGLTVDDDYVALQSTGTLAILAGSGTSSGKILLGVSSADAGASSSTVALDKTGITLNSTGKIELTGTGGITLNSGNITLTSGYLNVASDHIQLTSGSTLDDAVIVSTIRYYKKAASNPGTIANNTTHATMVQNGWSQTMVAADDTNTTVWSTIQTTTKSGTITYSAPVEEAIFKAMTAGTYKVYQRNNSSTVAPTFTDNTTSLGSWSLTVPEQGFSLTAADDTTVGEVNSQNHSAVIEHREQTPNASKKYVWSISVVKTADGKYHFQGTPILEADLSELSASQLKVKDIISGNLAVPYVKSSGLTIDGGYVALQSAGVLRLLGNSEIYVGTTKGNNAFLLNKDGITIGSNGQICIYNNASGTANSVEMTSSGIAIKSGASISIDSNSSLSLTTNVSGQTGNSIVMNGSGITIDSGGSINITSSGTFDVWTNNLRLQSNPTNDYPQVLQVVSNNENILYFHKDYGGYVGGWFVNKAWWWSGLNSNSVVLVGDPWDDELGSGNTYRTWDSTNNVWDYNRYYAVSRWALYAGGTWPEDSPARVTFNSYGLPSSGDIFGTSNPEGWAPFRVTRTGDVYAKNLCIGNGPSTLAVNVSDYHNWDGYTGYLYFWVRGTPETVNGETKTPYRWIQIDGQALYNALEDIATLWSKVNAAGTGHAKSTTSAIAQSTGTSTSHGCFVKGTLVKLADGSCKPIEQLQIGMEVLSYNHFNNTFCAREIMTLQQIKHRSCLYDLYLSSGKIITVTDSHPFLTTNGWKSLDIEASLREHQVETALLKVHDELINDLNEHIYIEKIQYRDDLQDETVYNCGIEDTHTFIVEDVVVHNIFVAAPLKA